MSIKPLAEFDDARRQRIVNAHRRYARLEELLRCGNQCTIFLLGALAVTIRCLSSDAYVG
jgi:hypothetical protein